MIINNDKTNLFGNQNEDTHLVEVDTYELMYALIEKASKRIIEKESRETKINEQYRVNMDQIEKDCEEALLENNNLVKDTKKLLENQKQSLQKYMI